MRSRHPAARHLAAAAALATAAAIALALGACGSSSEVVAEVQGATPVTKAMVDHWTKIESILAFRTIPVKPVPKGVVPVPPDYTDCIAFLSTDKWLHEAGKSKPALKHECDRRYHEIRAKAVRYMLAYRWAAGELQKRHLKVTQAEVAKNIRFFETHTFRGDEFKRYMANSGESRADLHFIIEYTVMGTKLLNDALMRKGLSPEQMRAETATFARYWTERTTCKPGYMVGGCKGYKGSETPL